MNKETHRDSSNVCPRGANLSGGESRLRRLPPGEGGQWYYSCPCGFCNLTHNNDQGAAQ